MRNAKRELNMRKLTSEELRRRSELSMKKESEFIPTTLRNNYEYMDFQKAGLEWMLSHPFNSMLVGDDMGLGKSLQAIGFANERRIRKILIIAPSVVTVNWENELRKFHLIGDTLSIQRIKHKVDDYFLSYDVHIVSYNLFDPDRVPEKTLLIVDESHYLRSTKSKRSKAILNKKVLSKFRYKLFLTGTPLLNRPIELYTIIKACCHQAINFMDKHNYGVKYCGGWRDSFGMWRYDRHSNLEELNRILRGYLMLRREKTEVLKQLPEKIINIVQFEMDATVEKLDAVIRPFKEEIVKGAKHGAGLDGIATHRRLIGEKKSELISEFVKMELDTAENIIVFAFHRSVIEYLSAALKSYGVSLVIGGMSAEQKAMEVSKFTSGANRVFLGNIGAAGVGITLVNCSHVIMAEPDWVPGNNDQAIDRAYRIGQKSVVNVKYLVYKGSVEEYILNSNFKKRKVIKSTLE